MIKIRTLLLGLLLLGLSGYMVNQYFDKLKNYYDSFVLDMKEVYFSYFPYQDKYFTYISAAEKNQLKSWLKAGEYNKLNVYFDELTKLYKSNILYEFKLYESYDEFEFHFNYESEHFEKWIAASPQKPFPFIARAYYNKAVAWAKRGGAFISKTSQKQISEMSEYMHKAESDAEKAIALDENNVMPYLILLDVYSSTGRDKLKYLAYEKANKLAENSYVLKIRYQKYIQSKWGGSDAYLLSYTKKQLELADKYPWFSRLMANYYLIKARHYGAAKESKDQTLKRMALVTKSLSYDRYWDALHYRGVQYKKLKEYSKAIDDFSEVLMRKPTHFYGRYVRAKVYNSIGKIEKAEKDLNDLMVLYPDAYKPRFTLIDLYYNTNRFDEALALSLESEKFKPEKKATWLRQRGHIYFVQGKSISNHKLAKEKFMQSIELAKQSLAIDETSSWAWSYMGLIGLEYIKDYKLAAKSYQNASKYHESPDYLYDYALALYRDGHKDTRKAYEHFYEYCKTKKCNKPSVVWTGLFLDCLNGLRSCQLDRHDYDKWL